MKPSTAAAALDAARTKPLEVVVNEGLARSHAEDGVRLVRASEMMPLPVLWLWLYWLARGKLHILAGPPGSGKTTLMITFIAIVTTGGQWPDGSRCKAGNVLIWSGEDDAADTLVPRLIAAGADMTRVWFITGARVGNETIPFDPARDLAQLTAEAAKIGDVALLAVDPIVSAVTGDSHKNTEVRRALQPLVDLAAHLNAAVLGISHFSKGTGGRDPTERVTGSVAFGAVARIVLVAAKSKGDDGSDRRRVLARTKSNIGPDDGGFEYYLEQTEINPTVQASKIVWGQAIAGSARDMLAESDQEDDSGSALDSACRFLRDLVKGEMSVVDIKSETAAAGFAWATVRRAKDRLGLQAHKLGMGAGWVWRGPEGAQDSSKVLNLQSEHLREKLSAFDRSEAPSIDPEEAF